MKIKLPAIIQAYVDVSNQHDVTSILSCFSEDAVVQDEAETLREKPAIEGWIRKTIGKYKFQFKPVAKKKSEGKSLVVEIEVSGTFDGSPVTLDYDFVIEGEKIRSLTIE